MSSETKQSRIKVLLACGGLHIVHDGISNLLYVLLPYVAQQFGLSLTQVGSVRAAYGLAMGMFQVPAGLLAERVGERPVLIAGTVLTGGLFALSPLSSGFVVFLILMFAVGVAQAVQHPLCSSLVSRAFQDGGQRGALGTYNFAGDVGKFGIAGISGALIGWGVDWKLTVVATGGITVALGIALWVVLSRLKIGGSPAKIAAVSTPLQETQRGSWGIRDKSAFTALCGIGIIDNSARTGLLTFVAFLMTAKGVDPKYVALSIPAVIAGGMFGKLACGFIADRWGVYRTVIATELSTCIGIVFIVFAPGFYGFLALPVLGVVLNGTSSVLYGTIGELVTSEKQSRTFGVFYTLSSFSGMIAPLVFGVIGDATNVSTALLVSGAAVLLTLPMTWLLNQRLMRLDAMSKE